MTEPSALDLVNRNLLLAYTRRRLDEAVLGPLRLDTVDHVTLHRAEAILEPMRAHFRGLGIILGPLRAEGGTIMVDVRLVHP